MKKKKEREEKQNLSILIAKTFTYWLNTNSWVKNTLRYDKIEVGKESNCSDVRVFHNKLENKRDRRQRDQISISNTSRSLIKQF